VRLVLGMPEQTVIASLTREYDLAKVTGSAGVWQVYAKHTVQPRGTVRFRDGQLNFVDKNWGPESSQKGFEFARSLYFALKILSQEETLSACKIEIELTQDESTTQDNKFIYFICGEHRVIVGAGSMVGGPPREFASIGEVLGVSIRRDSKE
jgi:hypothetical protein